MKFKRYMTAIYSSALVLGLTFLLYPQSRTASTKEADPVGPTSALTPSATPVLTLPAATGTPEPTGTTELTPSPAPERVHPIFTDHLDTPVSGAANLVTAYIESYYKNDIETLATLVTDASMLNPTLIASNSSGVTKVTDLKLYAKPGINGIFSVVYATYSLYYDNTQPSVPQFSEYYVMRKKDGTFLINTTPLSSELRAIMAQARTTDTLMEMAISSLIQRYYNACLAVDEPRLKQCVTDMDYLNLDYFSTRFAYTEYFSDYKFVIYPGINEFDYIVYVTYKEKIVLIDTPAPCMEYYYISLDPASSSPRIYLGVTSLDTDAYCAAITQSEAIQTLAKETNQAMTEALLADDDLKDFYNRLLANSPAK